MGSKRQGQHTIATLARDEAAAEDLEQLVSCLRRQQDESRFLEWKAHPPTGSSVQKSDKYRLVKAAIAFANTDGGFIICGVSNSGSWDGLQEHEWSSFDPAHADSLINKYVSPVINHRAIRVQIEGRLFILIHVPPSDDSPHVLTDHVKDEGSSSAQTLLAKHAIYMRRGAKCELATAADLQRIIRKRVDLVRNEITRVVKTVQIPTTGFSTAKPSEKDSQIKLISTTGGPTSGATVVRLTRDPQEASSIVAHEMVSSVIFEEVNNIVQANFVLSQGREEFMLSERAYSHLYSRRAEVDCDKKILTTFTHAGLYQFASISPCLYWMTQLDQESINALSLQLVNGNEPQMRFWLKIILIAGDPAISRVAGMLESRYKDDPQPPNYYYSFKKWRSRCEKENSVLVAIDRPGHQTFQVNVDQAPISFDDVIKDQGLASKCLTDLCQRVGADRSVDKNQDRQLCRALDLVAYANLIRTRAFSDSMRGG